MKSFLKGLIPLFIIAGILLSLFPLSKLPGYPGEIFQKMLGFIWTPVFMEITIGFLAVIALLTVNNLRLKKDGDDYITMEIPDDLADKKD